MKSPLHYQISEYDCGPTTLLNALNFLFEREEIPPDIIRNIMLYCLDCYSPEGSPGKRGTSKMAMMFISSWLNGFSETKQLNISCEYLTEDKVHIGNRSIINDTLKRGGVVVVRLYYDVWHYVLLTGIDKDYIMMFDPYYNVSDFKNTDIIVSLDTPFLYNRLVPFRYFNKEDTSLYSLGSIADREAVVIFNEDTKIEVNKNIEYFI
jgi:hypothetical protein